LDADVLIAGDGSEATKAWLQKSAAGLPNLSLELGVITPARKRTLFSQASWVVLPYTAFHSQSGVLADAYAYRVPLIVSDVGALGPTVRDDQTGFVVPPCDAAALASALLASQVADRSLAHAQLTRLAQERDEKVIGRRLRELYDVVTGMPGD
jgi:glycosyltransferase involved in cell wall biosynthesis